MSLSDRTHLEGRFAVTAGDLPPGVTHDHWGGEPLPGHIRLMHQVWAGEYVRRLASGDAGGAVMYLRALRFEQPDADPWRLIEQVAGCALTATPDMKEQVTR